MKITFIGIGYEHLSISILSAIAKKHGHQTSLAYFSTLLYDNEFPEFNKLSNILDNSRSVLNSIIDEKPDVLALSAVTNTYQTMLSIASEIKKHHPEIKTIIGGPHASAVPERVILNTNIDYIVIGEGDDAFIKILDSIKGKDFHTPIENTWFKDAKGNVIKGFQKGFIQDLNALPQFDKDLWADHVLHKELYVTMTSRGCPFKCTFCFNNFFKNIPQEELLIDSIKNFINSLSFYF